MDNFYGIRGIQFIWHGESADPEIKYKKHLFDYYDLEDYLWDSYKEEKGKDAPNDGFGDYVRANAASAKGFLDDLYASQKTAKKLTIL